jgi:hypothetical protein
MLKLEVNAVENLPGVNVVRFEMQVIDHRLDDVLSKLTNHIRVVSRLAFGFLKVS